MMLAAVETVTKADPVWASRRPKSDVAAQAAAGDSRHAAPPFGSSGRNGYTERPCQLTCPLQSPLGAAGAAALQQHCRPCGSGHDDQAELRRNRKRVGKGKG